MLEERRVLATLPSGFSETVLAANLSSPVTLDIEQNGRLWVAFQDGRIEVLEPGSSDTTLAFQLDADGSGERGLQGIELDPNFETNHYLYVYYTARTPSPHNRLSRLTVNPTTDNTIIPGSELVLFDLPNLADYGNPPWHIGGAIHFASDGTIRVQVGESQQAALSQDLDSPLGKVLRVNPDGTVPADNPYYNASNGITYRDYVWASGLRNPFAGDIDPVTGRHFIADVGAGSWEEINDATLAGRNFGWPSTEGTFNQTTYPNFTQPMHAYSHSNGCAITGGAFYNGGTTPFPAQYRGKFFFSEFCGSQIRYIDPNNPAVSQVFATDAGYPMNIESGTDGALYYVSRGVGAGGAPGIGTGSIRKIVNSTSVPPQIVINPGNMLASVGYDASFTVSAAGSGPLSYQWQVSDGSGFVDIDQATTATLQLPSVGLPQNGHQYRCRVTNSLGSVDSTAATLRVTADTPPLVTILTPLLASTYRAGDTISFSGAAIDIEDGPLSAADLTWQLDFHHNVHSHPLVPPTSGLTAGQITIPTVTEIDDDVWYRITLSATDSAGLTTTTFRDVTPLKTEFVVQTNLPGGGGEVIVDSRSQTSPYRDVGVENVERTIAVPNTQVIGGTVAFFDRWSDGVTDRERTILTPVNDTAYVALYRTLSGSTAYLSDLPTVGTPINGWGPIERDRSNGELGATDGNPITLNGVTYAKGLGVHADSEVVYNLGGGYSRFVSDIGVDDENAPGGSVVFRVLADGVERYNSGTMTNASATQTVNLDVAGVNELKLIVETAGDGNGADHADWADARLFVGSSTPVVSINFQLAGAPVPSGYLADVGNLFGNHGSRWQYGWSTLNADQGRDRNVNADQRLDTLVHFRSNQTWEITLPNGEYQVTATVGDAGFPSTHSLAVEGVAYWNALPLVANQFATQTTTVVVSDGRLTLSPGNSADRSTRITHLDISQPSSGSGNQLLPLSVADANLDGHLNLIDVGTVLASHGMALTSPTPAESVAAGDFDFDADVDADDWGILSNAWQAAYGQPLVWADVAAAPAGDFNRSGLVEATDADAWIAQFGTGRPLAIDGIVRSSDGNLDGVVDAADYTIWRDNLGVVSGPTGSASLVPAASAEAARTALLAGVNQIAITGSPGRVAVFDPPGSVLGEGAFGVMHDGQYRPIVAAAYWGDGRIVAFGHNGYLGFNGLGSQLDTGRFYRNSVAWASGLGGTNQAILTNNSSARDWLIAQGYTNVTLSSSWQNLLTGKNLLIAELAGGLSAAQQTALSNFVQGGGGLITGGTGWGYESLGNNLLTLPGNVLLREAGLGWTTGFREATTNASLRSTQLANASQALTFALQYWAGGSATPAQLAEAGEALSAVIPILPSSHQLAIDIAAAFASRAAAISATPATPVSNALDKAVLTWEARQLASLPVALVTAHHTAATLYGTVPASAPRIDTTAAIDTSESRWHATGLYVAPGEIVTVTVPSSLVGRGYKMRINSHTDDISQRSSWERMPVVHRSFDITQSTMQVASAFGGLLYIDFGSAVPNLGILSVSVSGAVEAPYFVLGEHTNAQWNATLRNRPAPFGVFVSDNLIIALPKADIEAANLTTPLELMTWWDAVVAQQDDLAAQTVFRKSPELINVDVQISAGAAHSGYPIQAYRRYWGNLADWSALQVQGSWGDFHELGHNHQRGWWTFDGDGEVSVNIFSNYNLESSASNPVGGWGWSADPVATIQEAIENVAGGGTYSSKPDRWAFWFQLADGFGWDAYKTVFTAYEADAARNPSALPTTNQQEKDQWFTRWSNAVGYDMKRFMVDTWGLEVSASALSAVSALPDWMPLAMDVDDFSIDFGQTRNLPLATAGIGMDDVATLVSVTSPTMGQLVNNGNGTYTYSPNVEGGTDSYSVTYRSSAGNQQSFVVTVTIGNGYRPGDVNLDNQLTMADVDQFRQGWRAVTTGLTVDQQIQLGDLNLSGTTDFSDWSILRRAWQQGHGTALSPAFLLSPTGASDPSTVAANITIPGDAASDALVETSALTTAPVVRGTYLPPTRRRTIPATDQPIAQVPSRRSAADEVFATIGSDPTWELDSQ